MIIAVKNSSDKVQVDNLIKWIKSKGLSVDISVGETTTVIGLVGDTSKIDIDLVRSMDIVEHVT